MEKRPNSSAQQQAKQQQQTATFELVDNSDLSKQAASCSPRRRNAPIDIDTALRLQSQASYVQEPARVVSGPTLAANGAPTGIQRHAHRTTGTPTSGCDSTNTNTTTATTIGGSQHQAACGARLETASADYHRRQQQQQQRRSRVSYASLNNFYDHYDSTHGGPTTNHISVDYIDCLSNNDLIELTGSLRAPDATTASSRETGPVVTMRGIPSCRKHLSRFQRSHRVEPCQAAAGVSSTSEQQKRQQPVVTSGNDTNAGADQDSSPKPQLKHESSSSSSNDNNNKINNQDSNSLVTSNSNTTADDCSSSAVFAERHHSDAMPPNGVQNGVLYPISVSEAKERTYFIGSVGRNSLLSHEELHRYFPNGRVSIFACTWNQNRKRAPMNLNDLLLPERLVYLPDIYAIGIQEAYSSQQDYLREWEIELQTTLGPNHVLLHSCSLGTLHLALFIRRDLIWFCSAPEESLYNSRSMPTNMIKTKGAISIAFRFFGTSFMFTNCHFPAHENKLRDRIDEYQRIINSIDLPKNLKLLKPRYLSNDSTARFDCVFFMGDLNFRLEQRTFDETIQILEDIFQSKEPSYEALTQHDELLKVMESQQAFHGFDESQIRFPPTYKFIAQTNKYDRQSKRVPSYTDRILFRSKRQRHIQCLIYDWLPQLLSSDHKPVYCLFDVLIRPGHDKSMLSSLNAGLFQRAVYMEALKRQAEDSDDMRDNGASGNLICSIS
jgi:hypothetical protein